MNDMFCANSEEDLSLNKAATVSDNSLMPNGPGGDCPQQHPLSNNQEASPGPVHDQVMRQVQGLMGELEEKREADKRMLKEFRSRLQDMVDLMCHQVEKRLMERHQTTNKQVEVKLQYLKELVDKVSGLESEISNFKSAVGSLFKEVSQ